MTMPRSPYAVSSAGQSEVTGGALTKTAGETQEKLGARPRNLRRRLKRSKYGMNTAKADVVGSGSSSKPLLSAMLGFPETSGNAGLWSVPVWFLPMGVISFLTTQ
ncbi:Hypothetical predicted protein [Podarcis lilfordi]|uniref:Uncharacterized protein n=1 Tax=Podarcis lilfordi TaxID=74358 RepID=A0AA35KM37_9SAUR|nr:Hypothetical predicted protein [Podarcis lilfordi]